MRTTLISLTVIIFAIVIVAYAQPAPQGSSTTGEARTFGMMGNVINRFTRPLMSPLYNSGGFGRPQVGYPYPSIVVAPYPQPVVTVSNQSKSLLIIQSQSEFSFLGLPWLRIPRIW